jgi:transposase
MIEPFLPVPPERPKGGRPRVGDRAVMTRILFVLLTGISWAMLPREMGCGSGVTCWRRLRDWHKAVVWTALHHALLTRLHKGGRIDWSRACMDHRQRVRPCQKRGGAGSNCAALYAEPRSVKSSRDIDGSSN